MKCKNNVKQDLEVVTVYHWMKNAKSRNKRKWITEQDKNYELQLIQKTEDEDYGFTLSEYGNEKTTFTGPNIFERLVD